MHFFKGDRDTAFQFYAQSLAMARELDVRDALVHGLNNLAVIFVLRGQLVQADNQLAEAEQLAEEIGHRQTMALLRYNRALLTWYQGDAAASRTKRQGRKGLFSCLRPRHFPSHITFPSL